MTTTRYIVRDRATAGTDFLMYGDDDLAAAIVTLVGCHLDGIGHDVELVTITHTGTPDMTDGIFNFHQWFDKVQAAAYASTVGQIMTANNYTVSHTGGGCLCWERPLPGGFYLWICDEGNDLGDYVDEPYLVGCYDAEGEFDQDTAPNLAAAIAWCNERAADPAWYIAAYNAAVEANRWRQAPGSVSS